MKFGGLVKASLSDFPGHVAAVVFTKGCSFRCPYCHNPHLLETTNSDTDLSSEEILAFLKKRIGKLTGLVVSGGEPCIQPSLTDFLLNVKKMGYAIKLDTNGSRPSVVRELLNRELVNYIAMDVKATSQKYDSLAGVRVDLSAIEETIQLIKSSGINHEFRTTVLTPHLTEDDILEIGQQLKHGKWYILQQFRSGRTLDGGLSAVGSTMKADDLKRLSSVLLSRGINCRLR